MEEKTVRLNIPGKQSILETSLSLLKLEWCGYNEEWKKNDVTKQKETRKKSDIVKTFQFKEMSLNFIPSL